MHIHREVAVEAARRERKGCRRGGMVSGGGGWCEWRPKGIYSLGVRACESSASNPTCGGGALAVRCGRGLWPRRMPPRGGASFAQPALRLELLFLLSHICGIVAALCLLVPFTGVFVLWFVYTPLFESFINHSIVACTNFRLDNTDVFGRSD